MTFAYYQIHGGTTLPCAPPWSVEVLLVFNFFSSTSVADAAQPAGSPHLLQLLPGAGLTCVMAMAATLVSTLHGGPQFLYALFFGVAFHYLSHDPKTMPGIEFCSRTVLRVGVGLLGARITASQIVGLGWSTAVLSSSQS